MLALLAARCVNGQGTFIYDQQSSTDETPFVGGMQVPTFPDSGNGQSFTPELSSVGFIRLLFNGGGGATVYVNLRSASINGPIIGTSGSVRMSLSGPQNFLFPTPVGVTPGTPYYFEAIEQSGTAWNLAVGQYPYSGGNAYLNGVPNLPQDYWFREGIIVPEPSSAVLLLLGGGALFYLRRSYSK
jgi:hypothetical protein